MVRVDWVKDSVFEASPPSGIKFRIDSHTDHGGTGQGPTPVEAFLTALAACSAIDVLSILEKKRQKVTSYRVEVDGDRIPPGTYPRPFTALRVRHIVSGENIDPAALARAVELSDEKYCSVIATLREGPAVSSEWSIEPLAASAPLSQP